MTDVWILGRWIEGPAEGDINWEVMGAFRTRDEAIAAGRDNEFVARLPVGERSPDEPTVMPDSEWIADVRAFDD